MREPQAARQMARFLTRPPTVKICLQTLSLGVRTANYGGPEYKWRRESNSNPRKTHSRSSNFSKPYGRNAGDLQPLKLKKVSTSHDLTPCRDITGDMMVERYQRPHNAKNGTLATALDALQTKYKSEAVTLGTPPKTLEGYVGTKIAFSEFPTKKSFGIKNRLHSFKASFSSASGSSKTKAHPQKHAKTLPTHFEE